MSYIYSMLKILRKTGGGGQLQYHKHGSVKLNSKAHRT